MINRTLIYAVVLATQSFFTGQLIASDSSTYKIDSSDFTDGGKLVESVEKSSLSMVEIEDLQHIRQEEKLARDVYLTLYDIWGLNIFSNIAKSEQTHTDAVKTLIDRYELEDSAENGEIGVFEIAELQNLYDDLVEEGSESLEAALNVGATVEDLDIFDLQNMLDRTDNTDIRNVYSNLQRGSRNHMRAFGRQLARRGASYKAQYLTQDQVNKIMASDQERGRGSSKSMKKG